MSSLFAERRELNKIQKGGELTFTPKLFALKHYAMQINVLEQESSAEVLRLCLLQKERKNLKKNKPQTPKTKEESCLKEKPLKTYISRILKNADKRNCCPG